MSNLRNRIIRLAHQKPELREHLLPLVKEANSISDVKKVFESLLLGKIDGYIQNYEGDLDSLGDYLKSELKGIALWGSVQRKAESEPKIAAHLKANFNRNIKALSKALKGNNSAQWEMSFAQSKMFNGVRPKDSAFALDMLTFLKKHRKEITGAALVEQEVAGDFKRTFPTARVDAKLVAKDIHALTGYDVVGKMMYDMIQEADKNPYSWYKKTLAKL